MTENFLSRRKADALVIIKGVDFATKWSRLKLAMRAKALDRECLFSTMGQTVFEIYHSSRTIDAKVILGATKDHLDTIERLDVEIANLTAELEQAKADFRNIQNQAQPPQGSKQQQDKNK